MKIYAVSCNPGRFERLTRASAPLGLDIVSVDSPLGTDPEVVRRGKTCFERKTSYPTGLAATLGHMRAMQCLLDSPDDFAIIIEDDVRFHREFDTFIPKCEEYMRTHPVDIVTIGFVNMPVGQPTTTIEDIPVLENVGLSNPWGCQCYMISRDYARRFLDIFKEDDLAVPYDNHFVTDWVIYDPVLGCRRSTLVIPRCVESPDEQSVAGDNSTKPNLFEIVRKEDFYL